MPSVSYVQVDWLRMSNIYLMAEPYVDHSAVFYSMLEAATKSVIDGGAKID
jgi:hypothetical protein